MQTQECDISDVSTDSILIVEDEESLADLFAQRLNEKFETTVCYNAGNAVKNVSVNTDCVLLDRRLPGMSGDRVLEYIADQPYEVSVIIISAIDPDQDVIHHPYDEYITKTVDDGEIRDAINRVDKKNRFVQLLANYVRKAETLEVVKSQLNTTETDGNIDVGIIEEELKEIADEFATLSSELSGEKATDILCEVSQDDLDC